MILIAASNMDTASLNITRQLFDHYSFDKTGETFQENPIYEAQVDDNYVRLATLRTDLIYAQDVPASFPNSKLIVFVSRHSSISGTPTLSVHTPGNFGEAKLGGIPRRVSVAPANTMRDVLDALTCQRDEMGLDYEVSYECTHHGPSINIPTMFVELGSSRKQWNDSRAAEAIAHATVDALSKFGGHPGEAVIGIGGPHYNMRFTRKALVDKIAFGHMIPKYALPIVDLEILKQCVERTFEKVEFAALDWKGIKGEHKPKLMEMLEEIGLSFQKI